MKVKLGKALEYEQPSKYIVESEKYKDEYKTPVLTAGKSFILGYTNETTGIYDNLPVIIFDDFTTDVKFVDFPFKVKSSAMKMLQPSSDEYNLKYFYYLIKFLNFQPTSHQRHWISKFAEFEFNIPDKQKQDEIVEKLDKMAEILSLKDKELKKYDELIKSQFSEMFDNVETQRVEDVVESFKIGPFGSALHKNEISDNGFAFVLGTDNAVKNYFAYNEIRYIDESKYNELINYKVTPGDVIMSMMGTVGKTAVIPNDIGNAIISSHLCIIRTNKQIMLPDFFQRAFHLDDDIEYQIEGIHNGSIMKGFNLKIVKNFKIKTPSISQQKEFLEFTKHIDKLKFSIKQSIEKLENCYNSLMQEYFN